MVCEITVEPTQSTHSPTITVEPTTDETYIKSVFLNPEIYAQMKDDSCPADPVMLAGVDVRAIPGFFLKALVNGIDAGVFWFIWKDRSLEVHTALLGNCRGSRALKAARAARDWVFGHTEAEAVTSYAWSDSPSVAWFCRAMGMEKTRTEPWRATRGGRPVDITYYSIGRAA